MEREGSPPGLAPKGSTSLARSSGQEDRKPSPPRARRLTMAQDGGVQLGCGTRHRTDLLT